MNRISVSSWSLHPQLGAPVFRGVGEEAEPNPLLLQLPRQLADFGAGQMEICHFHLSRDPQFLRELRAAIDESDVKLLSVLVDAGDITGDDAARDEAWIASWLAVAQTLGAERLRVIAGKAAPTPDNLAQSRAALGRLADEADKFGVRITTENWFDLLQHPRDVLDLLTLLQNRVGLNFDFGNWNGDGKYQRLKQIAPLAESCHAKAHFSNGKIDSIDFEGCLQILKESNFTGPFTLVCDDEADRWRGLEIEKQFVEKYL